ncbi:MAG: hypothetical protein IPM07_00500 [Anaerolineales bacterium]|nr:hypothetical protein [Anaerolineales bacterium]
MSETLDRMRRLHNLRPRQSQPELTYIPIDESGDPLPPRRASRAAGWRNCSPASS